MNKPAFICGLDLAERRDYSAMIIAEWDADGSLDVVHMQRWRDLPYPQLVRECASIVTRNELRPYRPARGESYTPAGFGYVPMHPAPDPILVVDATGVGRPVVELFMEADLRARVVPVTITSAIGEPTSESWPGGIRGWKVGKKPLVSACQVALQTGALRVVPTLALAGVLRDELSNYRVKISESANELFDARSGANDDLVLAVALATWAAGNRRLVPTVEVTRGLHGGRRI